jgi:hypothetical protein
MIYQRPGFERRYKRLPAKDRARVDAAIQRFAECVGKPHEHSGIGLRQFGRYLEFRAGLHLRVLVLPEGEDYFLVCTGDHDDVRA